MDDLDDLCKVEHQIWLQGLGEEYFQKRFIRQIRCGDVLEVVFLDELGELVGGDHDGAGDGKVDFRVFGLELRRSEDHVYEGKTSAFASQRTSSDPAEKEGFVVVVPAELGDDAFGSLAPIGPDDFDEFLLHLLCTSVPGYL